MAHAFRLKGIRYRLADKDWVFQHWISRQYGFPAVHRIDADANLDEFARGKHVDALGRNWIHPSAYYSDLTRSSIPVLFFAPRVMSEHQERSADPITANTMRQHLRQMIHPRMAAPPQCSHFTGDSDPIMDGQIPSRAVLISTPAGPVVTIMLGAQPEPRTNFRAFSRGHGPSPRC